MSTNSTASLTYIKNALEQVRKYDFASAVHALEKISNTIQSTIPESKSLYARAYGNIQFRATVRHAPSATAISHAELRQMLDGNIQPILWVNFTGIAGIQGPLPLIYTERVFRNMRNKDYAFASFLDMFNHRVAKLTYDLQQWIPGYSACPPECSQLGKIVLALGGVEPLGFIKTKRSSLTPQQTDSEAFREKFNDECELQSTLLENARYLITYKTLFVRKVRSAAVLEQILQNFFNIKACVSEFQPTWVSLRNEDITKLGGSYSLGKDTFLGNRVWRYNKSVNITLKNMPFALYESFNCHVDNVNWKHLQQLTRMFLPTNVNVRYLVQLQNNCKRPTIIGEKHNLGFNTWLGTNSTVESCIQLSSVS
ncbi:MAG: type VI secretion system baseplate subunit TssG [Holosporales bacterium]|jgi:type VI secretion system protein ImpH|nr:type VI secretion system baseplate subunit TssG [Holosporales bacterium]